MHACRSHYVKGKEGMRDPNIVTIQLTPHYVKGKEEMGDPNIVTIQLYHGG
jgi:hypothetical protein